VDVILAEELGCALPAGGRTTGKLIDATLGAGAPAAGAPCEFLGPTGCAFPDDLRPYGCAALICQYMRNDLTPAELAALEAGVAELEVAHAALMSELSS